MNKSDKNAEYSSLNCRDSCLTLCTLSPLRAQQRKAHLYFASASSSVSKGCVDMLGGSGAVNALPLAHSMVMLMLGKVVSCTHSAVISPQHVMYHICGNIEASMECMGACPHNQAGVHVPSSTVCCNTKVPHQGHNNGQALKSWPGTHCFCARLRRHVV